MFCCPRKQCGGTFHMGTAKDRSLRSQRARLASILKTCCQEEEKGYSIKCRFKCSYSLLKVKNFAWCLSNSTLSGRLCQCSCKVWSELRRGVADQAITPCKLCLQRHKTAQTGGKQCYQANILLCLLLGTNKML